jgi:hypothetical protein
MRFESGICWAIFLFSLLITLLGAPLIGQTQSFHPYGDCNGDGWCNWADADEMVQFFRGGPPIWCIEGADVDGDTYVNGLDVTHLITFFKGGPPPANACTYTSPQWTNTAAQTAQAQLVVQHDTDPLTATFRVYVTATVPISNISFSYQFNPADIAGFSVTSLLPNNMAEVSAIRPFAAPYSSISLDYDTYTQNGQNNFPTMTAIYDLVITAVTGLGTPVMSIIQNDPIFGPPLCYFGPPNSIADNSIAVASSFAVPGDANGDGNANGIDVVYMVNYLKNIGPAPIMPFFDLVPINWNY